MKESETQHNALTDQQLYNALLTLVDRGQFSPVAKTCNVPSVCDCHLSLYSITGQPVPADQPQNDELDTHQQFAKVVDKRGRRI